jgi:rhomboid family protein
MGIYDREYYRGETGGPGWFGGVAPWCKTLIAINCAVFLVQHALLIDPGFVRDWLEASPDAVFRQGRIWQLLTATFLHAGFFHLFFNMMFLWMVGREMESLYGSRDFLAFYLSAAVVSTFCWCAIEFFQPGPHYMLGASGAVMAVLTLYTLFYPKREVLFFFIVPMPMWVLLCIFLFAPLISDREALGVAYQSHLAGALFGLAFKQFDLRYSRLVSGRFRRPRLRVFMPAQADQPRSRPPGSARMSGEGLGTKASTVSVIPEEQLDARLDEVLAKIAREGRSGLTDEEQRVLQEASRRARDKRSDRL